jgi:hypothetical protein
MPNECPPVTIKNDRMMFTQSDMDLGNFGPLASMSRVRRFS